MSAEELNNLENLPPLINEHKHFNDIPERDSYENLCRGKFVDLSPQNASKLYCYNKMDKVWIPNRRTSFLDTPNNRYISIFYEISVLNLD